MNAVVAFENNVTYNFLRNKVFKGKLIHYDTTEIRVEQVCQRRV